MFTEAQKIELGGPLCPKNVKTRSQGGRQLRYVEAWHAIEEANRIFGFDSWSRETVELKCVSERERDIGTNKLPGWGVTYTAKVRVRVGDVTREGCGAGHGIDRDLGQAHESALKEAESDAMKRAFMTFGNKFGLALYDKTQANVSDGSAELAQSFMDTIDNIETVKGMDNYGGSIADAVSKLPTEVAEKVRHHFGQRKKALKQSENLAA